LRRPETAKGDPMAYARAYDEEGATSLRSKAGCLQTTLRASQLREYATACCSGSMARHGAVTLPT